MVLQSELGPQQGPLRSVVKGPIYSMARRICLCNSNGLDGGWHLWHDDSCIFSVVFAAPQTPAMDTPCALCLVDKTRFVRRENF